MSRKGVVTLLAVFVLLGLAFSSPVTAAQQWTFMVYLDADNNLESFGIDDFLEMATVGSNANINIIVQMDRIPGYDTRYGDWTTTKRFRVTQGMTPTTNSQLADIGEANMGDPATLTAFINWATSTYPASYYALILWNHGGGWRQRLEELKKALKLAKEGAEKAAITEKLKKLQEYPHYRDVCVDETNNDRLYTKEVKNAINAAATKPHLIGFDACLMAMTEVAYELRGTGPSVMVGSEKTEPGDGWPYDTILADLNAHPAWTPTQLGTCIVDRYYQSYGNDETQSCMNLAQMTNLATAISAFATSMINNWNTNQAAVKTAAQNVINALNAAVIHEQHGAGYPGAHGLTIYFPTTTPDANYNGSIIDFPGNTTWDEFLTAFVNNMGGSWIAGVRSGTQTFDGLPFADLEDFCTRIINYVPCGGYTMSQPAYAFEDISATGTNLSLTDDSYGNFAIPFTFNFYGNNYTAVCVQSNGAICFQNTQMPYLNHDIPAPNGIAEFIALFWDDLNPGAAGDVRYQVLGSAPNRRLIVQWTGVPHYGGSDGGTFQAILYEGTNNIRFNYQDVYLGNPTYDYGASATIGIQRDETCGLKFSYNTASLTNNESILFTKSGPTSNITPILQLLLLD